MTFDYDATGIQPSDFSLIPKGWYLVRVDEVVNEGKSSKGNDMVTVHIAVSDGEYKERKIMFHNVVFLPKETNGKKTPGAGMAIHFLKCIGEPHENKLQVNTNNWIGKKFNALIDIKPDNKGVDRNYLRITKPESDNPDFLVG